MTTRLMTMLKGLSALTYSEHPVLSVYLDWSVDSTGQRQSLAALDQELDRYAADLHQAPMHHQRVGDEQEHAAGIERAVCVVAHDAEMILVAV